VVGGGKKEMEKAHRKPCGEFQSDGMGSGLDSPDRARPKREKSGEEGMDVDEQKISGMFS
jgi:hypothetical protein